MQAHTLQLQQLLELHRSPIASLLPLPTFTCEAARMME